MRMLTPPVNQGQIVEVSYGWHDEHLYMRVYDRSDRSESWYIADEGEAAKLPEGWEAINDDPPIPEKAWRECDPPDAEEL